MQTSKPRLSDVPWNAVETINHSLCEKQKVQPQNGKNYQSARRLWEKAFSRSLTLPEALDVCKQCNDLIPFTFNSGNTFASISRNLVEDWATALPSLESQILRSAIGHYVNGLIGKRELKATLHHLEAHWKKEPAPPEKTKASLVTPSRQEQPA
jgi:hypothetical protein